jgi:hypothetical protein
MRLNDGLPVWHLSVSVWSRRDELVSVPAVAEKEAIRCLRGVGGGREWWFWNEEVLVGHLRVAVTSEENALLPGGVAEHDAGESGPERSRSLR